ncbi:MAG: GIY-YIG nuclease family protein [Syntrophomonadaceae bacterium]
MKISKEKKKELQAQYKLMKPEIGIFAVINKSNSRHYLEVAQNLKGKINGTTFQLNAGSHPNRDLQKDWLNIGAEGFEIRILEQIECEDDKSTADYKDEMTLLKMIWSDKLTKENIPLY